MTARFTPYTLPWLGRRWRFDCDCGHRGTGHQTRADAEKAALEHALAQWRVHRMPEPKG